MNRKYRTGRVADHLFSDAAHEHVGQTGSAVSRHHN
jgi:hypothetical protein